MGRVPRRVPDEQHRVDEGRGRQPLVEDGRVRRRRPLDALPLRRPGQPRLRDRDLRGSRRLRQTGMAHDPVDAAVPARRPFSGRNGAGPRQPLVAPAARPDVLAGGRNARLEDAVRRDAAPDRQRLHARLDHRDARARRPGRDESPRRLGREGRALQPGPRRAVRRPRRLGAGDFLRAPGAFSPNPKGGFLRIVETVGTREQLGVGPHGLDLPAATNRLEGVPGVNRQEIEVWDIAERKRVEHTESAKKGKPQ